MPETVSLRFTGRAEVSGTMSYDLAQLFTEWLQKHDQSDPDQERQLQSYEAFQEWLCKMAVQDIEYGEYDYHSIDVDEIDVDSVAERHFPVSQMRFLEGIVDGLLNPPILPIKGQLDIFGGEVGFPDVSAL